ncbi:MAG: hypothetical protein NTY19_25100 [Planctomycetota bacterium]|nr:hypothetical protein [Planctomycetota bacterium]
MNKTRLTTTMALLLLTAAVIRADTGSRPKGPPAEKTLTGKLAWTFMKRADGTEVKSQLKLQTADAGEVSLGTASRLSAPATLDVEKFVGKNVIVTVMAQETKRGGKTSILVRSIKDMKEVPSTKAKEIAPDIAPSAKHDNGTSPAKP